MTRIAPGAYIRSSEVERTTAIAPTTDTVIMLLADSGSNSVGYNLLLSAADIDSAHGIVADSDAERVMKGIFANNLAEQVVLARVDTSGNDVSDDAAFAGKAQSMHQEVMTALPELNHFPNIIVNNVPRTSANDLSPTIASIAAWCADYKCIQAVRGPAGMTRAQLSTWAASISSPYTFFTYNDPEIAGAAYPSVGYVAGAIARQDNDEGWQATPHYAQVRAVTKTNPAIYSVRNVGATDDLSVMALAGGVGIVPTPTDGWRLWGHYFIQTTESVDEIETIRIKQHVERLLDSTIRSLGRFYESQAAALVDATIDTTLSSITGARGPITSYSVEDLQVTANLLSANIEIVPVTSVTTFAFNYRVSIG